MPKKEKVGTVVSDKMDKTLVVSVQEHRSHVKYGKYALHNVKFKVHDENNEAKMGDLVRFAESRRISKDKCWRLVNIEAKAEIEV